MALAFTLQAEISTTEKNIFLYFYLLIFFIPLQAMKSATASARFFTLHSSLFTFH